MSGTRKEAVKVQEALDDNEELEETPRAELSDEDLDKVAGGMQGTFEGATPGDYSFQGHVFRKLSG